MKNILLAFTLLISACNTSFAKNEPYEVNEVDNSIIIDRISNDDLTVKLPSAVFSFTDADIKLTFHNPEHTKLLLNKNKIEFIINGTPVVLDFINGEASFKHNFKESNTITIYAEDFSFSKKVTVYPLWAILIPLAIILLYIIKRAIKK